MAFPTKDTFTFDFEAQTDYPNWTPAQTKEHMNERGEELRVALNAVANLLNATTSDVSGADNTGIPETVAGSGTNVRDRADWLYAQIVAAVLGAIPDGSLTTAKYADGSVTAAKCAADVATQAELDDLAGVGRTTETVKGNADALGGHQADLAYQLAGGKATALTVSTETLVDGYAKTFIASANNNGTATTINTKPLYKPNTVITPTLITGKAYTVWYSSSSDCFFIKASAEGTASVGDVLAGKTFSNDNDTGLTGTMPNRGTFNLGLGVSVPAGYYSGGTTANGKRYASGTTTSGSNNFQRSNDGTASSLGSLTVSGLTFTPSFILAKGSDYDIAVYDVRFTSNYRFTSVWQKSSNVITGLSIREASPAVISATGFTMPVASPAVSYSWIAFE